MELAELSKHRTIWCYMSMAMCILHIPGLDMFHKALVIRNQSIGLYNSAGQNIAHDKELPMYSVIVL